VTTRELQAHAKDNTEAALAEALGVIFINDDIPLTTVIENPCNHRRTDSDAENQEDAELTESIRQHGVLQPPLVWRDASGLHHIIGGHRRCRCARRAGKTAIPARIIQGQPSDEKVLALSLTENIQRLNIDPLQFGLACLALMPSCGTASQVAKLVHKSISSVTRSINLVQKLPAGVRELIKPGGLPPTVARELISLPDVEAQLDIANRYVAGLLRTRTDVTAAVNAAKNGKSAAGRRSAGFVCDAGRVRVSLSIKANDATLAEAEGAIRQILKDMQRQKGGTLAEFQQFLQAKAREAAKTAELQAAQNDVASRLKGPATTQ